MVLVVSCLLPLYELRRTYLSAQTLFALTAALSGAMGRHGVAIVLGLCALIGALVLYRWHRVAGAVVIELALILSPLLLFSLGGLARLAVTGAEPVSEPLLVRPSGPASTATSGRRVVIVVLDELDYRLSFPERPPAVRMPTLDALRAASVFATQARSPAMATNLSLPSYLTGRVVARLEPTAREDAQLEWTDGTSTAWSRAPNVLAEAEASGFRSAMVGFFLPYCRIIGSKVTRCAAWGIYGFPRAPDTSVFTACANELLMLTPWASRLRMRQLLDLTVTEATADLMDPRYRLVFVHLPTPHPPGIYDPVRQRFTAFETDYVHGYEGNLAEADATLAQLFGTLKASSTWDSTAVVVTSDHPWRDAKAFMGKGDLRVPLPIHLPGQSDGTTVNVPINTVGVGHLALALLDGKITTADQVAQWLVRNASSPRS